MNEQSVVGEPSGVPERARTEESGGGWPGSDGDLPGGPDGAPPRRAASWWVKRGLPPVALLAVIFAGVQGVRPLPDPALALDRSAAFTFGGGEFAVPWPGQGQAAAMVVGVGSLGRSGGQRPVPTASVAKVMTAYVILKGHPLRKDEQGPQITVDAKAEEESKSPDESTVPLRNGQRFTERQMLQMLLIPSSNNAARQLARWDAGSEDAFAKKMNAAAGELGMTQTTYTDPSGFMESTKSTAVDQLKLAEEVMKADAFRQIVRMTSAEIPGLPKTIYNSNELLTRQSGMAGIKTGSTTPAGGALMWAAYRTVDGRDQLILGVTMDQRGAGADPKDHLRRALEGSRRVIEGVRSALTSDVVVRKGQVVGYVDDGLGGRTPVVATADLKGFGWPGLAPSLRIGLAAGSRTLPHEAKKGTEVGVVAVGRGMAEMRVPVALGEDLEKPSLGAKMARLG